MRALLQRVATAAVTVEGETVGRIGPGILVLAGVKVDDGPDDAAWIAGKIAGLRIFPDDAGRMNRSVVESGGEVLLVSQFTLYGDARKGRRPSFEKAARPETAVPLLDAVQRRLVKEGLKVETGRFGAHMEVALLNDGPVTLLLDSERPGVPAGARPAPATLPWNDRDRLLGGKSPLRDVPLVLASASPRRRDLLAGIDLPFTVEPTNVDESRDVPADPEEAARTLAERKARAALATKSSGLVLAADTLVIRDGKTYGKPADEDDALRMLRELSGAEHRVITGVCVASAGTGDLRTRCVTTRVRFHAVGDGELRRYVKTGESLDKAGAYAIQGRGSFLVAGVEGDYSNVIGLPVGTALALLAEALEEEITPGGAET